MYPLLNLIKFFLKNWTFCDGFPFLFYLKLSILRDLKLNTNVYVRKCKMKSFKKNNIKIPEHGGRTL